MSEKTSENMRCIMCGADFPQEEITRVWSMEGAWREFCPVCGTPGMMFVPMTEEQIREMRRRDDEELMRRIDAERAAMRASQ